MKRAIGVAALGGGLLALSAGTASAQEVSTDGSARVGRSTSAEVRVCADGRVLSSLVGSCSGPSSDRTSATVRAGRGSSSGSSGVRARVPRVASADVSIGTRRSRPGASASGQASVARRARADAAASADTSPRASADATASLSRPRARRLLDLGPVASLAGVGLLGSSPFTLVGDPASDNLLPTGELTLDGLTGQAPAGIGVLESGPIASGNQVDAGIGDISPSVPVTVCGNGAGVLGDASASCGTGQAPAAGAGSTGSTSTGSTGATGASAGTGGSTGDSLLGDLASGNQVDAGIGDISPSIPVAICGNGVGVLGDTSAGCGAGQPAAPNGSSSDSGSGAGTSGSTQAGGTLSGNQVDASVGDISPSVPVTVCGNGVGALGDASAACGSAQPAGSAGGSSGSGGGSTGADAPTGVDVSTGPVGTGISGDGSLLDPVASGNQVDAGIGSVSASVPLTVCGNGVGALGDSSASCGSGQPAGSGTSQPSGNGGSAAPAGGSGDGTEVSADGVSASAPVTVCGNGVGLLGDASSSCGSDTSTGGIIAPPPATTPGGTDTGTSGTSGTPGSIGTSGTFGLTAGTFGLTAGTFGLTAGTSGLTAGTSGLTAGTSGLTAGTSGGAGDAVTSFAPLRSLAADGSGALPFTGAASDLLAVLGATLLTAGFLAVRATRPDTATKGGGDR